VTNIVVIGINHRTAPLNVREKLWFSSDEIREILPVLKSKWFSECFLVSTCNRTELYGISSGSNGSLPGVDTVGQALIEAKSAGSIVESKHLYDIQASAAVNHLFKVASGVDSMVVGDVQILGQIKEAYTLGRQAQTVGMFLNRLLQSTLRVGKRSKTETRISEGAISVSYAAVELAERIFANLSKRTALLIGAGETGELTARHLVGKGIGKLLVANRTRAKAEELVGSLGGEVIEFDNFLSGLNGVDIIITSIDSPHFIITADRLAEEMRRRAHKPLIVIDMGVPRNVEPSANTIENVFVHDLDALGGIVARNLEQRRAEIPKVNEIILQELKDFYTWYKSLEVAPTIGDLHMHFEEIRRSEVEKHSARFSSVHDRELLDLVTKRIVNKLLHLPTTILKNGHEEPDDVKRKRIHVIRSLFGLNKNIDEG
jgi:glutamyl-tRNA reductase